MKLIPFVKWVGGKRQLYSEIKIRVPDFNCYFEPFLGGGAVLLGLSPDRAVVSDLNSDLIALYKAVRDSPKKLLDVVKLHDNNKEHFVDVRSMDRDGRADRLCSIERAARLMYLNRAAFNGLYRVNTKGQINSSYGYYKELRYPSLEHLYCVSDYFKSSNIDIINCDYLEAIKKAKCGDFVYLDPPYLPLSKSSNFTSYQRQGFGLDDLVKLRDECQRLSDRGVNFLLSNTDNEEVRDIFSKFTVDTVETRRNISAKSSTRGIVTEVMVRNYKV